jgi:quercetin dioxygenase-like cupin family protein
METIARETPASAFSSFEWKHKTYHGLDPLFPSSLQIHKGGTLGYTADASTVFGYIVEGMFWLNVDGSAYPLLAGMYFSCPRKFSLTATTDESRAVLMQRIGYKGVFHIGGPVEDTGRLRYIDGCTDTLLIPPQRIGEPCLNLLVFPPGVDQTAHTHPSDRIGVVVDGLGHCAFKKNGYTVSTELEPGMIFCIHAGGEHKFATPHGKPMRVIAFHPDSDFGPTDEDHPMINRTIVDGRSAKLHTDILTDAAAPVAFEMR